MIINPVTNKKISHFVNNPSHSLVVISKDDIHNDKISLEISSSLLGQSVEDYPYHKQIKPENGSIGIEKIRDINEFLKLKVPLKNRVNRVCVISQAQTLTIEAQNALLKTLEEPNAKTLVILCTSNANRLLPTILSRCQKLLVRFPNADELTASSEYSFSEVNKAYNQAGGLPELTLSLLNNSDHPLNKVTETTKKFLSVGKFDRLAQVNSFKDKESCQQLVSMTMQIARLGIKSGKDPKWLKIHQASYETLNKLESNTQLKLVMTEFSMAF